MRRRKKLFMFIAIVLVFMLSFVSIDTSAAGFLYSSRISGVSGKTIRSEGTGAVGTGDTGTGDMLWSSFFVTLLAKKYHYSIMQLPLLHAG